MPGQTFLDFRLRRTGCRCPQGGPSASSMDHDEPRDGLSHPGRPLTELAGRRAFTFPQRTLCTREARRSRVPGCPRHAQPVLTRARGRRRCSAPGIAGIARGIRELQGGAPVMVTNLDNPSARPSTRPTSGSIWRRAPKSPRRSSIAEMPIAAPSSSVGAAGQGRRKAARPAG